MTPGVTGTALHTSPLPPPPPPPPPPLVYGEGKKVEPKQRNVRNSNGALPVQDGPTRVGISHRLRRRVTVGSQNVDPPPYHHHHHPNPISGPGLFSQTCTAYSS